MYALKFLWPYAALVILTLVPLILWHRRVYKETSYLKTNLVSIIGSLGADKNSNEKSSSSWLWIIIFWLLMTSALMRPQFVGKPIEISRSGRSILLTLDISQSMEQQDLIAGQPADRLSVAKSVLHDFIDHRKGDRLGLVLFGSESFLHAPLSFDHIMIKRFLDEALIGFLGPKTAIGDAIGLSVKKLMEQPEDQERIMILLTDGQNNSGGLEPLQAAEIAKVQNVKIYIVGLGASHMMVDGFFGRGTVNPSEDLDEAEPELKKIAALTGGEYFRAKDIKALTSIYAKIDKLEPVIIDTQVIIPKKELFYWPLACAIFLLIIQIMYAQITNYRRH